MVDVLMIKADDPKVLSQYHRQKLEFQFQQKSDNDFVSFLLDTAVRVISIVQQLAPVLEAVSSAGTDQTIPTQSDFNMENPLSMETESCTQPNCITPSNKLEQTTNLDVETLPSSVTSTPVFNVNHLGSALKSFAPPTSAFQTSLNSASPSQVLSSNSPIMASGPPVVAPVNVGNVSSSPALKNLPVFSTPTQKVESMQLDAALEFDKTISALQKELDSVSQSLVTETDRANTAAPSPFDTGNLNNLAIIKRLQENFKETGELTPQSGKDMDLIKTIQDTITNRGKSEEVVKVKEEMDVIPTLSMFRDSDSRQSTDRLQQLMSSLNNPTSTTAVATPSFSPVISTALNQISSLAPSSTTALNQLTSGVSPGPSISPGLKGAPKKNGNPLSMLHLQGNGGGVDQAAILSVLYNDRNATQSSPDLKHKSSAKSSPNKSSQCPICGRVLRGSNKRNLQRHINLVHLKLKPYHCKHCGRSFGLKAYLKAHILTHTSENRSADKDMVQSTRETNIITKTENTLSQAESLLAALKQTNLSTSNTG